MWPLLGDGIFSQEGAAWKHSRKLLVPQFHFKQYQNLEILREPMDDLLRCIEDGVKGDGGVVDLQPLFFRFTLDSTTAFLLGESVNSLKSGAKMTEFERAFNSAQSTLAARFQLANLYWVLDSRNFRKDCKIVQDFCDAILARSLDEAGKGDDRDARYLFLDAVAKEYPNRVASRQQMMNILIAGYETFLQLSEGNSASSSYLGGNRILIYSQERYHCDPSILDIVTTSSFLRYDMRSNILRFYFSKTSGCA